MSDKALDIKHFINTQEFAKAYWNEDFHPLDVHISYKGESIQIRSKMRDFLRFYHSDIKKIMRDNPKASRYLMMGYFTDEIFDELYKERIFPLYDLLVDEIDMIRKIIEFNEPFDIHHFTARNFTREYVKHTTEISHILDDAIKDQYMNEIKSIFAKSVEPDKSKDVFKISNYFIHFIDWDNTFADFYEMTYEVMPKALRQLENYFSEELRIKIRGYMAFSTQVKILKRQFEKAEPGKISLLSYFEWEAFMKKFITEKFVKIFGKQKTKTYVESLHMLIENHMKDSSLKY